MPCLSGERRHSCRLSLNGRATATGHRFANAFHLRGERGVGLREFLEGKARNLGDDVINARLEAGGRVMECAGRAGAATALSGGR